MAGDTTTVHVLRHGEVHNPSGVLYGRLPGFNLSERGLAMAERIAEVLGERDITAVIASPLERAQQTAAPTAAALGLPVRSDDRLLESLNIFEGKTFGVGDGSLTRPRYWWHLRNPLRPSWGEAYVELAARMRAAIDAAAAAARGHEALVVSHQLPIWTLRQHVEGKRLFHDPRKRQCALCSITSFTYEGDRIVSVAYSEPAADMLTTAQANQPFSTGT